jgi:pantoate--beta-alanine ligase
MQIITTVKDMKALFGELRSAGKSIGFAPTMGALHEGHLSLIRRSKRENDATVVSIFVNPTQFGPIEDFNQYPRDTEGDLNRLSMLGTDIVYMPEESEMYPDGASSDIHTGALGMKLCGATRPGHFDGVATVVARLFRTVKPNRAYFGQKDFQQTVIIKKLVQEHDFHINIVVCPIIREPDGLAMSSRNSYLNQEERRASTIIYRAIQYGKILIDNGELDSEKVKNEIDVVLKKEPLANVEYIEIVDTQDLNALETVRKPTAICLAVWIGDIRLIDNIMIE